MQHTHQTKDETINIVNEVAQLPTIKNYLGQKRNGL